MSACLLGWSVHGGPTNPRIEANVTGLDCGCLARKHVQNLEFWMGFHWQEELWPSDAFCIKKRVLGSTWLGEGNAPKIQKSHGEWESLQMLSLHCSNCNWWPVCLQAAGPQRAICKMAWRFGGQSSASPSSLCLAAQSFLLLPCTELMVKKWTKN